MLEADWFTPLLKCVACHDGALTRHKDEYRCAACEAVYPVSNDVPMLLAPSSYVDAAAIIAQNFGSDEPGEITAALATAMRYQIKDPVLRSEFSNMIDRHLPSLGPDPAAAGNSPKAGIELRVEYFNPAFDCEKTSYRTIRIKNHTDIIFHSSGDQPYYISYHLFSLDGSNREIEGVRSRFPIPLKPGAELSIPVAIKPPPDKGAYLIRIEIVHEYVRWFPEWRIIERRVEFSEIRKSDNIVRPKHNGFFDFEGDLTQCGAVIQRAVRMLSAEKGRNDHVVLEMACGSDPQSLRHYQPGTRVVACDICFPQVQIASIAMRRLNALPQGHIRFAAADSLEIPFRTGTFDLIVISAALHHISNVTDALNCFRSLLKEHGKIVILREPCLIAVDDPVYIQELERGFNEQQFELAEYDEMFKRTGLHPVYEQIDYECSYKAILELH
jgi:SAM-dependent methyltransferase